MWFLCHEFVQVVPVLLQLVLIVAVKLWFEARCWERRKHLRDQVRLACSAQIYIELSRCWAETQVLDLALAACLMLIRVRERSAT